MSKAMVNGQVQSLFGERLEADMCSMAHSGIAACLANGQISSDEYDLAMQAMDKAKQAVRSALPDTLKNRVLSSTPSPEMAMSMDMPDQPSMGMMMSIRDAADKVVVAMKDLLGMKESFDESAWDGSASQWDTPAAYCSDCLIDLNEGSDKTKDKCHLPYRKPGSSSINKNALRAIAGGARGISALKGVPEDQKKKAANWVIRHYQAAFDKPAPDGIYQIAGKTPPSSNKSSATFYKDANGKWNVVLLYTNKYEDTDKDILTSKAHEDYATWVNQSGFKPQITIFHQPQLPFGFWAKVLKVCGDDGKKLTEVVRSVFKGYAIAEADRVVYMNGFGMMVGSVYPEMEVVAEKLAQEDDLGCSHGFLMLDFSPREDGGIIVNKYRSFEASVLPRYRAANILTTAMIGDQAMAENVAGNTKLSQDDMEWLTKLLGEERVTALSQATGALEATADKIMAFKAAMKPDDKKEEMTEPTDNPSEEDTEKKPKEEKKEAVDVPVISATDVAAEVMKALNVEGLQTALNTLAESQKALADEVAALKEAQKATEGLVEKVDEIKKSDDERIAAQLTPVAWGFPNFTRPSQADGNVINPSEKKSTKKEEKPVTVDQVVEALGPRDPGAESKKEGNGNPLQTGLWDRLKL